MYIISHSAFVGELISLLFPVSCDSQGLVGAPGRSLGWRCSASLINFVFLWSVTYFIEQWWKPEYHSIVGETNYFKVYMKMCFDYYKKSLKLFFAFPFIGMQ